MTSNLSKPEPSTQTKFPVVLIHGMFGWGKQTPFFNTFPHYWPERLLNQINTNHIIVEVGVGSSDHDRACETFYQLHGGTVDYGKDHAAEHQHDRFGRNYPTGLHSTWSKENPVHLLGHSYGSTTALELYQLICDDFFGVGSDHTWVKSITCIAGPLTGSTLTHSLGVNHRLTVDVFSIGFFLGLCAVMCWKLQSVFPILTRLYDFRMQQWHSTNTWRNLLFYNHPWNYSRDNAFHSLTPSLRMGKNEKLKLMEEVYLINVVSEPFANANALSEPKQRREVQYNSGLLYMLSGFLSYHCKHHLEPLYDGFNSMDWNENDGIVNLYSMIAPRSQSGKFYQGVSYLEDSGELKKGTWSIVKHNKDHLCGTSCDASSEQLYERVFLLLAAID